MSTPLRRSSKHFPNSRWLHFDVSGTASKNVCMQADSTLRLGILCENTLLFAQLPGITQNRKILGNFTTKGKNSVPTSCSII